ncbi:MAG TPA: amidohydrolase family protein [Candidatus Brocadiia bacterium]|nr:amidohydrolase family protein [Candidatus Brocadiia bacterium]
MLINVHSHLHKEHDVRQWFDKQGLEAVDVTLVCGDDDKCEEAMKVFPGRVIALGTLSYDRDKPELVDEFHDRGFLGLKMISLPRAYDDPAYYPIYEKAAQYQMPILFHTGHLLHQPRQRRNVISRPKMDARLLDGIARAFPELYLIGAHLGNPCYEEACSLALKHPRVFFDLTGGTVRKLPYSRWRQLLMTGAEINLRSLEEKLDLAVVNKFVFGADGATVAELLEFYENLFRVFSFPTETRELILWRNAARMFGLEQQLEAKCK